MSRLVTFRVGNAAYAVPANAVQEVIDLDAVQTLPFVGNPELVGLARVRGRFIPVLEVPEASRESTRADESGTLLVLGEGRGRLGLRIEQLGEVVDVDVERGPREGKRTAVIRVGAELIRYIEPAALVGGREDVLAGKETGGPNVEGKADGKLNLVSFRIGPEDFALDVMRVHEVVRVPKVRRVPRAPEFVEGVAEVRDSVVPVIDLRKRFGAAEAAARSDNRLLIVSIEDGRVGLIVDEVPGVVEYPAAALSPAPRLVRGLKARYLEGVVRDDESDRLLILLDVDEVLESNERIALKALLKKKRKKGNGAADGGESGKRRGKRKDEGSGE